MGRTTASLKKQIPRTHLAMEPWTPEKFASFASELDAIHTEIKAKLGPKDVAYIKKVEHFARLSEILGRFLIHVSPDPLTWSAGVFALALHHQLHTTEIGHSALHGSWDGLVGAQNFYSASFKWKSPVDEESWKKEHNQLHHQYTNIVGKDPDLSYGILRTTELIPWIPYHFIQVAQFFWTAPFFLWVIATYVTGLTDLFQSMYGESYAKILPDKKPKTIAGALQITLKKMLPYSLYNFVFWPALAGPFWWKVLAGNLSAEMLRNIYSAATIYAGHFGDDLKYYDKDFKAHGRGEWYKAQVEAAHNYDVPRPISILCGALDTQIEHHLFPHLPPNRLREIRPKVQKICKHYGVNYHRDHWGKTLQATLKQLAKLSLPKSFGL
jgi:NADPH-dependent stearoyl-CoA 9-desaturase